MRLTNLRHLRVFDAVARLGSFVEASKALHMTPAAVSLAIRDLEDGLEFRVLERTTRFVRLTDAGRQYFEHVDKVLAEVRATEACAASLKKGTFQTVRIATTPPVIALLLGVLFEHGPTRWPNVRIVTVEVPGSKLPEAIDSHAADITIGVRLPNDEHNESQTLFVSRWVALLPRAHALAEKEELTWAEVVEEPIFFVNESSRLHIQAALPPDIVFQRVNSVSSTISAMASAAGGHGLSIVPAYVQPLAQVHKLRVLPISAPAVHHVLEIGVARRPKPEPHILEIRDFLLEQIPSVYRDFQ